MYQRLFTLTGGSNLMNHFVLLHMASWALYYSCNRCYNLISEMNTYVRFRVSFLRSGFFCGYYIGQQNLKGHRHLHHRDAWYSSIIKWIQKKRWLIWPVQGKSTVNLNLEFSFYNPKLDNQTPLVSPSLPYYGLIQWSGMGRHWAGAEGIRMKTAGRLRTKFLYLSLFSNCLHHSVSLCNSWIGVPYL